MDKSKTIILLPIATLVAVFFYSGASDYLSVDMLKRNQDALSEFHSAHPFITISIFLVLYTLQTALALPGAIIFALGGGALFGALCGTIYAVTAATIGATLAFVLTRYLFQGMIQRKFGSKLGKINASLEEEGFNYLLFLRFVPLFPFFLINLGAALTHLRLRTFFTGTLVGIIPGAFVYANAGASLATVEVIGDIASPRVLLSFVLLGLFALLPVCYRKLRRPVANSV